MSPWLIAILAGAAGAYGYKEYTSTYQYRHKKWEKENPEDAKKEKERFRRAKELDAQMETAGYKRRYGSGRVGVGTPADKRKR